MLFVYQDGQSLLSLLAPSSSGSLPKAASSPSRSALPPFPPWAGHTGLCGTQHSSCLLGQMDLVPQQEGPCWLPAWGGDAQAQGEAGCAVSSVGTWKC